ncbi:MAG: hypothetical protein IJ167_00225 [Lachnospiraceae bacterium]|nr:hypothetical protein [Lachnospiraceae bacterium]
MRKFRCALCVMVICAALGGCGDKNNKDNTAANSEEVTENVAEEKTTEEKTTEEKTTEEKTTEEKTTEEKTTEEKTTEEKTTEEKTTEEKKTTEATTQATTEAQTEAPTEAVTEAQDLKAIAQGYIGSDAYALIGAIGGNLVVVNACTDESAGYALIYYDTFTVQCEQATPDSPWIVTAVF